MRTIALILLIAIHAQSQAPQRLNNIKTSDNTETELENFQGRWSVAAAETRGRPISELMGATIVFDRSNFALQAAAGSLKGEVRFAPFGTIKAADFIQQGSARNHVWRAIYAFSEGDMKICYIEDGGESERPSRFATAPSDSQTVCLTLKRL